MSGRTAREKPPAEDASELEQLRRRMCVLRRKRIRIGVARRRWLYECQALEWQLATQREARASCAAQLAHASRRVHALGELHVLNDCFFIWHAGPFATINGFRLGRCASDQVAWHEVNAALGQVVALLDCVDFRTKGLDLLPLGSASRIVRHGDGGRAAYPLFTDDSFSILPKRGFNLGLLALLRFVAALAKHVADVDPALSLPHAIVDDKIGGTGVAYASNDDAWTLAMKCVLTNLKWVVAWMAKHSAKRPERP
ncbi:Atg6/Beclin [Pelagophyceae sp. CCMP2097]|nr:Atg6/Beclin [Pelagophyceae sp. CCMP2097]